MVNRAVANKLSSLVDWFGLEMWELVWELEAAADVIGGFAAIVEENGFAWAGELVDTGEELKWSKV